MGLQPCFFCNPVDLFGFIGFSHLSLQNLCLPEKMYEKICYVGKSFSVGLVIIFDKIHSENYISLL